MRALTRFAVLAGALAFAASAAQAAIITVSPIDFNDDSDYNNNASQTTGVFRDFLNGTSIERGTDVGGTGHTALRWTAGTGTGITVYDTTPSSNAVQNLFYGSVTVSGDFITNGSNTQGGGPLAVFTEGTGQFGVAYRISDTGGTDPVYISKVAQTGTATNLSTSGNTGWADNAWYRMVMTVAISGNNITITGQTYNHTTASNPNSAVGTEVAAAYRTYSSTLSTLGLNSNGAGEVGLFLNSASQANAFSATNFSISGNDGTPVAVAGGPYTVPYNGNINLDGSTGTGSYGTVTTWAWNLDGDPDYDDATGQTANITYDYLKNTLGLPTGVALPIGLKVTNDVGLTSTAAGSMTIMPEPATLAFLGFGAVGLLARRRRK